MEERVFNHTPQRKQLNKAPICALSFKVPLWVGRLLESSLTPSSKKPLVLHLPAPLSFMRHKAWTPAQAFLLHPQAYQSVHSRASLFLQRNSHTSRPEDSVFFICYLPSIILKVIFVEFYHTDSDSSL